MPVPYMYTYTLVSSCAGTGINYRTHNLPSTIRIKQSKLRATGSNITSQVLKVGSQKLEMFFYHRCDIIVPLTLLTALIKVRRCTCKFWSGDSPGLRLEASDSTLCGTSCATFLLFFFTLGFLMGGIGGVLVIWMEEFFVVVNNRKMI